jgi:hypothetical protein
LARIHICSSNSYNLFSTYKYCVLIVEFVRHTSRNVHIHDDFLVTLHLFVMEVVSTVTKFINSSQITSDGARTLKIMTKLNRHSQNNEPVRHRWIVPVLPYRNQWRTQLNVTEQQKLSSQNISKKIRHIWSHLQHV